LKICKYFGRKYGPDEEIVDLLLEPPEEALHLPLVAQQDGVGLTKLTETRKVV
jgi:hypothetical protein